MANGFESRLIEWLRTATSVRDDRSSERTSTSAGISLPAWFAPETAERPGHYPFSRGISERGYLDQPWVMGMYSGYATPRETNARFKALLTAGQTGLSVALDLPTQIGVDSDHPLATGEVGKVGVPLNSVDDMLTLLDGLPLDRIRQIRTTANGIGPIFLAFVLVALDELGIDPTAFQLSIQNDPLKEYTARGAWVFPPRPALKFAVDAVEFAASRYPGWQPNWFSGYHIRDSGGTAIHEVAISMANGIAYIEEALGRGLSIEQLAPQMFLFLAGGVDVFEEAAKFRAARRLWARLLHEYYGASPEKCAMRIFCYTLGGALWAQEPSNNIVRISYQALAAALGGVQTLATSSWDEAHGLPTQESATLALRTQQIIAFETGTTNVVDPLGGSYYVEALTDAIEADAMAALADIMERGGAVAGIESGHIAAMLAEASYKDFQDVEAGRRKVLGVNLFANEDAVPTDGEFAMPANVAEQAVSALAETRSRRDDRAVAAALAAVTAAAQANVNTVPALLDAVRQRASMGEIVDALAVVWGRYSTNEEGLD